MPPAAIENVFLFLTAAYARGDGTWFYEHFPVAIAMVSVCPQKQVDARCPKCSASPVVENTPVLRFLPLPFHEVVRAMCSSRLADAATLEVERGLVLRLRKIPKLSALRVDGEPFGELQHWSSLIEKAKAPNIVLFCGVLSRFFVVCAKSQNTQAVHTRSALCWLRKKAGLGFACDASGGVFSLRVSRDRCSLQGDSWPKDLEPLVSAVGTVFVAPSFDE